VGATNAVSSAKKDWLKTKRSQIAKAGEERTSWDYAGGQEGKTGPYLTDRKKGS